MQILLFYRKKGITLIIMLLFTNYQKHKMYLLTLTSNFLASLFANELLLKCLQAYVTVWHFIMWIRSALLLSLWERKKKFSLWKVKLLNTFDLKSALISRNGTLKSRSCSNLWGGVSAIIRRCQEGDWGWGSPTLKVTFKLIFEWHSEY